MQNEVLRNALIGPLDQVNADIAMLNSATAAGLVITVDGKKLSYKPRVVDYKEFLLARRDAIKAILSKLDVDVTD